MIIVPIMIVLGVRKLKQMERFKNNRSAINVDNVNQEPINDSAMI